MRLILDGYVGVLKLMKEGGRVIDNARRFDPIGSKRNEIMANSVLTQTIPQTRRRFQAKMLAPTNSKLEDDLYGARFTVPEMQTEFVPAVTAPGRRGVKQVTTGLGTGTAFLVPGAWKEVVSHEEGSWWPEGRARQQVGGGGSGRKRKSLVAGGSRSGSWSASGSGASSRVVSRGGSRAASRGLD
jgi:hypothetical protein